ncbi:amidase family protein [Thermoleophilum album]|uniref:Amidase n=1 Tax=Thermoleophilum album TaxID=29539 RepID=A0A1H6FRN7_THEAL|nr:amidase family protein [Thermoleophilum album]SEH12434.1 amidase [Thermoleophilum album]
MAQADTTAGKGGASVERGAPSQVPPSGDDLAFAGVEGMLGLLERRELSARELTEYLLRRIDRIDRELRAFRRVFAERALAEAEQADARRRAGDQRPLLGLPIAVKDDHDVAGELTALGSAAVTRRAREDCELVRRLRSAGAIVIGKTNVPELLSIGATESLAWGITRNPWNLERTPGGSSGGSAAAVAAGLVPAATGSDGAGSIRIPAACCHLLGLKPSRDLVPTAPLREPWHGMTVYGFLTRTVRDTALLYDACAIPLPGGYSAKARAWVELVGEAPGKLKVGVSTRPPLPAPLDATVRAALERVVEELRSAGHVVERVDIPYGASPLRAVARYLRGVADDARAVDRPERLQRRTRGLARLGRAIPDALLARARAGEQRDRLRIGRLFEQYDLLLTPTVARPPVAATAWEGLGGLRTLLSMGQVYPYTPVWNHVGFAAVAVPAGIGDDGLPRSVQLVARDGCEPLALRLAAQLEERLATALPRPPID